MITMQIGRLRLIERAGDPNLPRDIESADLRPGDVFESVERPIYQVDPETRTATDRLKQFKVGFDSLISPSDATRR